MLKNGYTPSNLHDQSHVGKLFGIGENESIGISVGSSSEAIPSTGGSFQILKDKSPLEKLDFKENFKFLSYEEGIK